MGPALQFLKRGLQINGISITGEPVKVQIISPRSILSETLGVWSGKSVLMSPAGDCYPLKFENCYSAEV